MRFRMRKSVALAAHRRALGACQRCELGAGIHPVVSRAVNPRAMLIGQAPGKVEAEGGVPFSGRAGRTLFRWLARAGIDEGTAREMIYISVVTRCYPGPHPSGRGDRVPGTRRTVEHAGGRSVVIPLPHPFGASSWIHQARNKILLEKAIELIGEAV